MFPRFRNIALSLLLLLLCVGGQRGFSAPDDNSGNLDRDTVMRSLMWGSSLTEDQMVVAAQEIGITPDQLHEMEIKGRVQQLIHHYQFPLELAGFGDGMLDDEEFRLYKSKKPGVGALRFNSSFWKNNPGLGDDEDYMVYLLLRAQVYYVYRTRYDAEHCAWIVEDESGPLHLYFDELHRTLQESSVQPVKDPTVLSERDLEFRRLLDPTGNPQKTLHLLIEYALRTIAQKSSDNWALARYREKRGDVPPAILERVRARERSLSYDFGRARFAMTLADRITFQKVLKAPFRYLRRPGHPSSEPVYDPAPGAR
jgi:hypothetical protein